VDDSWIIMLQSCVNTSWSVVKTIWVTREGQIRIRFELQWEQTSGGFPCGWAISRCTQRPSIRSLFFETHNGVVLPERFALERKKIEHGRSVSFLVSSSSSLGLLTVC